MIKLKSKKTRMGIMLFLVPALVIYLVFQIIPIIGSIYFSLVDWNGIAGSAPKFVGLKNYIDAFHNADFILSLKNMARMVIISVICHTPVSYTHLDVYKRQIMYCMLIVDDEDQERLESNLF